MFGHWFLRERHFDANASSRQSHPTSGQTYWETDIHTDRNTYRHILTETDRHTHRHTRTCETCAHLLFQEVPCTRGPQVCVEATQACVKATQSLCGGHVGLCGMRRSRNQQPKSDNPLQLQDNTKNATSMDTFQNLMG